MAPARRSSRRSDSAPPNQLDALTTIPGIDQAIAAQLADNGISTLAALAEADPEALAERLSTDDVSLEPATIAGWIAAARDRLASPPEAASARPRSAPTSTAGQSPLASDPSWQTLGSFELTIQGRLEATQPVYQTVIQHPVSNEQQVFEGLLGDRLQHWLLQRLETVLASSDLPSGIATPLLAVTALTLYQADNPHSPLSVEISRQSLPPMLMGSVPFTSELTFELIPWGQRYLQEHPSPVTCQVQVFAKPLSPIRSADHWRDATALPLQPGQQHYTVQFQPVQLGTGLYALQLLLLVAGVSASPVLLEIPVFQVN